MGGLQTANVYFCGVTFNSFSTKTHPTNHLPFSGKLCRSFDSADNLPLQLNHEGCGARLVAFATRKTAKKQRRNKEQKNEAVLQNVKSVEDNNGVEDNYASRRDINDEELSAATGKSEIGSASKVVPSRRDVLQACILTSAFITALGFTIRQVSTIAAEVGLPFLDCSQVSFGFEFWHLELIAGLVLSVSVTRYVLLKTWTDFAESSESANTQVLTSLQTFDYLIVAFLPGVSEELLFRGALLPLFGLNWKSALAVASIFGVLHLGSGRKLSFAIWATFVGLAYGYATILTSSVVVPMTAHTFNNLIGGILWYQTSRTSRH